MTRGIVAGVLALAGAAGAAEVRFTGALASVGTGEKTIAVRLVEAPPDATVTGTLRRDDGLAVEARAPARADALVFDVPGFGLYALEAEARAGDAVLATARTTYAVVPKVKERPRELGTCVHFAQGKGSCRLSFDLMRLAGISRVRDDLTWKNVERAPGRYSVPDAADALVARCEAYGLEPLFVFGYPNKACYPGGFAGKPFPTDDATRRACAEALAFVVRHFGPRVPTWELWNEPNCADPVGDYLPLLKAVHAAVKAARSEAKLISGGGRGPGGGIGGKFVNAIFGADAQDFQDGWSIHPYMAPHSPDHGYYAKTSSTIKICNVEQSMRYLLAQADRHRRRDGKALELWVTEVGWSNAVMPEERQAAYLARALLLFRRHAPGVPVFFYDFQDDGTNPGNREHNFGLIRADYSPKPSFQAMTVAASLLANQPFADALLDTDDGRVYGYGPDGRAVFYAAWAVGKTWKSPDAPDERDVEVQLPGGTWRLVDWQGRVQALDVAPDGRATLHLAARPCYLLKQAD